MLSDSWHPQYPNYLFQDLLLLHVHGLSFAFLQLIPAD